MMRLLMLAGALLGLSRPAEAAVVNKTGDICVQVDTVFVDLAGDNWVESGAVARKARGVRYEIVDATTTHEGWLGSEGCLEDFSVQAEQNNGSITLRVKTRARVNGVEMESWEASDYADPHDFQTVSFTVYTGTGSTFSTTRTVTNLDQRWQNLMVGTMVFRLYDWNITSGNDRDCCLEGSPGYDEDGSCTNPASGGYALITTPIQMQSDPSVSSGNCCGSTLEDGSDDGDEPPGLHTGTNVDFKFSIAHELGHIVGEMRTGGKEWDQYGSDVPEDGCNGNYNQSGGSWSQTLQFQRGEFTKEPTSNALREGWGNFVSTVTWNTRTEDSCEFQVHYNRHDFDLEGGFDTERAGGDLDGAFDCEGIPDLPGDPTPESYVTSQNWLEDLEDANDAGGCEPDADSFTETFHRTTVYDVTRFFWDLTTDQGLTPGQLSDLYVDMCPRGWFGEDYATTLSSDLPIVRLTASAYDNGIVTEVNNEIYHILH